MSETKPTGSSNKSCTESGFSFAYFDELTIPIDPSRHFKSRIIKREKKQGCASVGIFRDREVKNKLCTQQKLL